MIRAASSDKVKSKERAADETVLNKAENLKNPLLRAVPVGVVLQEAEYPPLRSVECGHMGRYHCQLCHLHKINIKFLKKYNYWLTYNCFLPYLLRPNDNI